MKYVPTYGNNIRSAFIYQIVDMFIHTSIMLVINNRIILHMALCMY